MGLIQSRHWKLLKGEFLETRGGGSARWHEPRSLGDVLKRLVSGFGDDGLMFLVYQHWEEAVGPTIADHCKPRRVIDNCLLVDVDHPGWATEIRYLEQELVAKLQDKDPKLNFSGLKVHVKGS